MRLAVPDFPLPDGYLADFRTIQNRPKDRPVDL
jgi:hypothetical protein